MFSSKLGFWQADYGEFSETKDNNGKFEDLTALPIKIYV
jgi:hypothetical protein